MIVRELVTRLGFNTDQRKLERYERSMQQLRTVTTRVAIGAAALTTGTAVLLSQFTQAATETLNWSNRLGVATDRLQQLQLVAEQYGVSQEALADGLKELSMRTDEFVKTGAGPAAEAIQRLNLSQAELNRVSGDTGELFAVVLDRLRQVDNVAARQRITDELFGGQAAEQFSEFVGASADEIERIARVTRQSGAILSERELNRTREFDRSLKLVRLTLQGYANTIATALIPQIRPLIDSFLEWSRVNGEIVRQRLDLFVDRLAGAVRFVADMLGSFLSAVNDVVQVMGGWENVTEAVLLGLAAMVAPKILAGIRLLALAMRRLPFFALIFAIGVLLQDIKAWVQGNKSATGKVLGDWQSFKAKAMPLFDSISGAISWVGTKFVELGKGIGITVAKIVLGFASLRRGIVSAWGSITETLTGALNSALQSVRDGFNDLIGFFESWAKTITGVFDRIMPDWLIDALSTGGAAIRDTLSSIGGLVGFGGGGDSATTSPGASVTNAPNNSRVQNQIRLNANVQVPPGTPESQQESLRGAVAQLFDERFDRILEQTSGQFVPGEG